MKKWLCKKLAAFARRQEDRACQECLYWHTKRYSMGPQEASASAKALQRARNAAEASWWWGEKARALKVMGGT